MKLLKPLLPFVPQPYRNIIKFFIGAISGLDAKRLKEVSKTFANAVEDGYIDNTEWTKLGGREHGLDILSHKNKK